MGHGKKGEKHKDKINKLKEKDVEKEKDEIAKNKITCKHPYVLCNINVVSNYTIYILLSSTCNHLFI